MKPLDQDNLEQAASEKLEEINSELIPNLIGLGLTHSEARVYMALVRRGTLTAVDACKLSRVPRAKIYEVLENLSSNGLCYQTPGKKKNYTVVNPKEGLQRRMSSSRKELERREDLTLLISDQLMPFYNSIEQSSSLVSSSIHFLSNASLTASVYLKILNEAENEILNMSKLPYNVSIRASQPSVHRALQRGVTVRVLVEMADCRDRDALALLIENQARGTHFAVLPALPVKLIVGDNKVALLILSDTDHETNGKHPSNSHAEIKPVFNGMLIEHVPTINLLRVAFESLWQQGLSLNEVAAQLSATDLDTTDHF